MSGYNPCIIIPVYNHQGFIAKTVEDVRPHGYPIFMIDDGSVAECQILLEKIAAEGGDAVQLIRLEVNQGKGAAVMAGFEAAAAKGFTHALQIDADGQHDIADIARFIERSEAYPLEVVSGKPMYDASVPKGRLYGRYITHFWVCVETLSCEIKDSMCGFRMYPLAATIALMNTTPISKRMDFDIEILVRLYWQGVPMSFIETKVIYPDNGVSHFDMLADNIRISKIHTKLFFGMLKRLPVLLKRKWLAP